MNENPENSEQTWELPVAMWTLHLRDRRKDRLLFLKTRIMDSISAIALNVTAAKSPAASLGLAPLLASAAIARSVQLEEFIATSSRLLSGILNSQTRTGRSGVATRQLRAKRLEGLLAARENASRTTARKAINDTEQKCNFVMRFPEASPKRVKCLFVYQSQAENFKRSGLLDLGPELYEPMVTPLSMLDFLSNVLCENKPVRETIALTQHDVTIYPLEPLRDLSCSMSQFSLSRSVDEGYPLAGEQAVFPLTSISKERDVKEQKEGDYSSLLRFTGSLRRWEEKMGVSANDGHIYHKWLSNRRCDVPKPGGSMWPNARGGEYVLVGLMSSIELVSQGLDHLVYQDEEALQSFCQRRVRNQLYEVQQASSIGLRNLIVEERQTRPRRRAIPKVKRSPRGGSAFRKPVARSKGRKRGEANNVKVARVSPSCSEECVIELSENSMDDSDCRVIDGGEISFKCDRMTFSMPEQEGACVSSEASVFGADVEPSFDYGSCDTGTMEILPPPPAVRPGLDHRQGYEDDVQNAIDERSICEALVDYDMGAGAELYSIVLNWKKRRKGNGQQADLEDVTNMVRNLDTDLRSAAFIRLLHAVNARALPV